MFWSRERVVEAWEAGRDNTAGILTPVPGLKSLFRATWFFEVI